jgi:hypothetical protein
MITFFKSKDMDVFMVLISFFMQVGHTL